MNNFKINSLCSIEEFIQLVKLKLDRDYIYAVYAKQGVGELVSGQLIYVGSTPSYDDDDNEILPKDVLDIGYDFFYMRDHFQDVIDLAVSQKANVSEPELIRCLNHYAEYDDFLDVTP